MSKIRDLSEQLWNGTLDTSESHPVHTRYPEGDEVLDGVLYYKGIAGATTVDTGDGLVMLDTGAINDAKPLHDEVRRWRPNAPLAAAIFSHHHVDHIFGVRPFDEEAPERRWPRPVVYAHRAVPGNFDRYKRTLGWNAAINVRQFALPVERFRWFEEYRYPDVTYDDRITLRRGDLTFEMHHGLGETDDATWTWIPERKLLFPGDLFIFAVPNAGNPQKVQRYAGAWAVALREMAALGAEAMLPGHGLPIFGADRVRVALTDTADLLDTIESQTIALMNEGAQLDRALHEVRVPDELIAKPYLRPVYDHPQFIVRNVWRLYGGWHDGEPDNLLPAPRAEQAREWVALAGGIDAVLKRASARKDEGNLRLACHLIEFAVLAEPHSDEVHRMRTAIYRTRSGAETSSMARNILNHAAFASEQGKRDLAGAYDPRS
jgi:alkyl sulfatase BDS1-like metallo-beta-lactamase superfamily hydrolase